MKKIPEELAERLLAVSREALDPDEPFSMNRVAKISGIPRATLYYYFSGKEDLVGFFSTWAVNRVAASARAAGATPGPIPVRLERALVAALDLTGDAADLDRALVTSFNETGALLTRIMEMRNVGFAPIRDLLVEGKASGELAIDNVDLMLTTIFGATLLVGLERVTSQTLSQDDLRTVIRMLIQGMLPSDEVADRKKRVSAVKR